MLMARPSPNGSSRHGPLPAPITLPSFRTFCAIAEQPEQPQQAAPPLSAHLPPPSTEPASYSRGAALTSPLYQPSQQRLPYSAHISDIQQSISYTQAPPLPSPHAPSHWAFGQSEPVAVPLQHGRQPFSEPFSPPRTQGDIQQHAKVVVQERIVDGKGLCYVYSDGTICPKLINGDTVNAKWGITKAGKPRKRLGQACNTCREKKIRCDPQVPKCAQCQKFGRDCKFETNTRSSQRSIQGQSPEGSSPTSDRHESIQLDRPGTGESSETMHERMVSRSSINDLISPRLSTASSPFDLPLSKKRKYSTSSSPKAVPAEVAMSSPHTNTQLFSPTTSPFLVDGIAARYYLDAFMDHFNGSLHHIFPARQFRMWANSETQKSTADILLLHSVLALGTLFCPQRSASRTKTHARTFLDVIDTALGHEASRPSLQLAQTLIYLSYYRLAKGEVNEARGASAFALDVCLTIGINYERPQQGGPVQQNSCFGFDGITFDECRRRTFWVAYITETSMLYCAGQTEDIKDIHCSLRVPCAERAYDGGSIQPQPVADFKGFQAQRIPFSPTMGLLAVFVEGYAILREALSWLARFKAMPASEAAATQADVQHRLLERCDVFYDYICKIDPRKQMKSYASEAQADAAAAMGPRQKPREAFILYHFIRMVLYRHIRHDCMPFARIAETVRQGRQEAFALLNLLWKLRSNGEATTQCPISGYAIFLAIDITTAGDSVASALEAHSGDGGDESRHERTGTGSRKAFTELLSFGIEVLAEFSEVWGTAKQQLEAAAQRFTAARLALQSIASRKPAYFFRQPLYSPFGEEADVVYGLDKMAFFRALGMGDRIHREADLYEAIG